MTRSVEISLIIVMQCLDTPVGVTVCWLYQYRITVLHWFTESPLSRC